MSLYVKTLAALAVLAIALSFPAQAQTFYDATEQEITAGPAGSVIRHEPMTGAPDGATAYRMLYRSTDPDNKPIAVSGVVIIPDRPMPTSGRPLVAWAHPTTGVVPACGPSRAQFVFQQIQGSRPLVERGYAIAATDYPGLGAGGVPHPYLVGVSEARAVIDSVRAASSFPGVGWPSRYAVWGHSQGGHAALFTGLIAQSYAPELQLIGVAAAAPATELATLLSDDIDTTGGKNLTAMTLWSWQRVFNAPMAKVVEPAAIPVVDQLAEECIESVVDMMEREGPSKSLMQSFLKVKNPAELEPWRSLLAHNTPGALPREIPIFLAQGLKDGLVRPEVTQNYMQRLCANGSRVRELIMPNTTHAFAAHDSAGAAVAWMADRFAGNLAPNDCGGR